ncbi:MAG: hypothetical protein WA821_12490 [Anaerolineales bacterium]
MPTEAFILYFWLSHILTCLQPGYPRRCGRSEELPLGYEFPLSGIVAALVVALFFSGLAAIIPARQATGMNVVEALRCE